jgi:hypothetical protein
MTQELYALGSNRSTRFAIAFLDHFAPNRKPCSDDYPVPESVDQPEVIFESEAEILAYLEAHPKEPYGLYWNDKASKEYEQAMLFYTSDGMVIFGLACEETTAEKRMQELRKFVGAEWAMMGWEQRPPETSTEFIALCKKVGA